MNAGGELELAREFAVITRALLAERSVDRTLERLCTLAVETVEHCNHAGVMLHNGGKIKSGPATDDVPKHLDQIQLDVNEGPCLEAIYREQDLFEIAAMDDERRWPRFQARAVEETPMKSAIGCRLVASGTTVGALNFYADAPNGFDDEDVAVAAIFAVHASAALEAAEGAKRAEQLAEAVQTRDIIGQAKGILMAREGVTSEQAFDILRRASQRLNVKLRTVAEQLVERTTEGEAPE